MNKRFLSISGLLVGLVLFVSVNILASTLLRSWRWDLTEDKLYTLSDGTKNILGDLEDPVRLRFYFSKTLAEEIPQVQAYAQRVEVMLEEYAAESDQLTVEVIEPEPFSEEEDEAVGFGLRGAPINSAGEQLYMGLVGTNSVDDVETVPFLDMTREELLEYDLSELVYNLATLDKRVVGIMSTLPLRGTTPNPMQQRPQPWAIVATLEKLFDIRWLDPGTTTEVPEDVKTLMLVHPKELSAETQFAIDQFVLGGGRLLAFVDPFCENEQLPLEAQQNPMMAQRNSQLDTLLAAWGVQMTGGKLAGDMDSAQRVNWRNGAVDFPVWLDLEAERFSSEDFTTSELNRIIVHTAGSLSPLDGATTTFEPLVRSSANAMEIDSTQMQFGPDPERMVESFVPGGQPLTIAARVHGPAKTAFPDGRPPASAAPAGGGMPGGMPAGMPGFPGMPGGDGGPGGPDATLQDEAGEAAGATEAEEPAEPFLTESAEPINVIVVADADFLHESLWARVNNFLGLMSTQLLADNGRLVTNCLENLTGSNDLIGLRSRGSYQRPFEKKAELEREASDRFRAKEAELEAKLQATEAELSKLQSEKDGSEAMFLSPEQEEALDRFREEQIATRKELREVKHQLRKDIESLGTRLKLFNVLFVPALILLGGLGLFAFKSRTRRK